jgi:hypothetical protein
VTAEDTSGSSSLPCEIKYLLVRVRLAPSPLVLQSSIPLVMLFPVHFHQGRNVPSCLGRSSDGLSVSRAVAGETRWSELCVILHDHRRIPDPSRSSSPWTHRVSLMAPKQIRGNGPATSMTGSNCLEGMSPWCNGSGWREGVIAGVDDVVRSQGRGSSVPWRRQAVVWVLGCLGAWLLGCFRCLGGVLLPFVLPGTR